MRMAKQLLRWAAVPCAVAALAGCGGSSPPPQNEPTANIVQPGAPGNPSRKLTEQEAASLETTKHTEADIEFMQAMIQHHAQAVLMAKWVPRRSPGPDVPLLAKRMRISQEAETVRMQEWLRARGVEPNEPGDQSSHDAHGMGAMMPPGMLTSRQLDRLRNSKGRAFDRLFLRYLIYHHQGALEMVRQLREKGGSAEPEINDFTRDVEADQWIEITRMQGLLAAMSRR